jgi:hypothetical protein
VFFRSDFNICSLVLAKRQFDANQWGNKPIGNEMQRILQLDNPALLNFGSGISFDNRFMMTCSPVQSGAGTYHTGFVILNSDLLSSLRTTQPSAWEGAWTGLNALQILKGRINGMQRCFVFGSNQITDQLELYELYSEEYAQQNQLYLDNGNVPITLMFETGALFNRDIHPITELLQLRDGEIQVSDIQGKVTLQVYYRPEFYPCWTLWATKIVCTTPTSNQATYHTRVGLGEPDGTIPALNRPMRVGRFFQFRFVVTGYCSIKNFQVSAITTPEPVFSPVNSDTGTACTGIQCSVTPDLQIYSLESMVNSVVPPVYNFYNLAVFYVPGCGAGTTLNFSGTLPEWITLDQMNNQLIGAAGVFGGTTQAAATAAAQAAINTFGNQQTALGNLSCASCMFNTQLAAHTYGIQGYFDGLLIAPSSPGCAGTPVWNGVFTYYDTVRFGFPNSWGALQASDASGVCISNHPLGGANVLVGYQSCSGNVITWQIQINGYGLWQKVGGIDPTGLYTFVSGPHAQPNLTIIQIL